MSKLSSTTSHSLGKQNARRQEAMAGDMIYAASPAAVTTTPAVATAGSDRTVKVSLTNANGDVHEWYNATVTSSVTIADTSSAGTASVDTTTATYVNGVASFVVSTDAAAWLATETNTLAIAMKDIMGYTIAAVAAASVDTITA